MADNQSAQLVVMGGGPGGYAAAFLAADLGLDVVLVDPAVNPGGVCLYRGCIPSKALLHLARLLGETEDAASWGVSFGKPKIDLARVRSWKNEVVQKLTSGLGDLAKKRKVRTIQGRARFRSGTSIWIDQGKDGTLTLDFQHAIIATGSCPSRIPFLPQSERIMNSTTALELPDIPRRLLVIGGGYIGLELGTVYAALGSKVTVVEMTAGLLPGVDGDLVRPLAARLKKQFQAIHLNTKLIAGEETGKGVRVRLEGEAVEKPEQTFDRVLVAVGRRPNSDDLGLDNTKVHLDDTGFIKVDQQRRTDEPNVFAIGDVAGQPMLAHKAAHEAITAVEVVAGRRAVYEPQAVPAVVFTDPEIAWCGLTENEAREQGRKVEIARFPWGASGRAATLGRSDGTTKLVVEPGTERILGVGICGPGAGELIAEGVLAIEMGAEVTDLRLTMHPHPTLSETLMEAAANFFGQSAHFYRPRRR